MNKFAMVCCITLMVFWGGLFAQSTPQQGSTKPLIANHIPQSVRFVYMVSNDRKENPAYKGGIEMAAKSIQTWYMAQLGSTFKLNDPVVEVVFSRQNAAWFYANPNGDDKDNWGYNNTFDEAARLLGVMKNDAEFIWVIYSDGPGNSGRGGSGVCIMPEDDLLGLIGQHPEQEEINRWIAGLGHEVGHAFGLDHPVDTEKDNDALMWRGIYGKYPDQCYLTDEDRATLNRSPFFFDEYGNSNAGTKVAEARFSYDGGEFQRSYNTRFASHTWLETKADGSATYKFEEVEWDDDYYVLKSVDRALWIRIPLQGGYSEIRTDADGPWDYFVEMVLKE
jgi:hypothetical protein